MTTETLQPVETMSDDELMALAREVAADDCSLSWHEGARNHRAIRITGCLPEAAKRIGLAIQEKLCGPADPETGLLPIRLRGIDRGFSQDAGFAAVWVR